MNHPITPPPELVEEWIAQVWHEGTPVRVGASDIHIATQAARWGADQELEACCEWLVKEGWFRYEHEAVQELRAARRPKPPSLAEQGLAALDRLSSGSLSLCTNPVTDTHTIRAALERLQELEQSND